MFCLFLYSSLQSNDIHNIINSNISTGALGVLSIVIMSILGCICMDIEAKVCTTLFHKLLKIELYFYFRYNMLCC